MSPTRGAVKLEKVNLIVTAPSDFLVGLGVAVAVKKPVRISVVVVTVTPTELTEIIAVGVDVGLGELQSDEESYKMPLIMTPSFLTIISLWSPLQVSGILRNQHVADGEAGKLFVCVAFIGPVVLYEEELMIAPVDIEVPLMIRAKT